MNSQNLTKINKIKLLRKSNINEIFTNALLFQKLLKKFNLNVIPKEQRIMINQY